MLGKNARAMYCVVFVGSTEKSTVELRVVQLPSCAGTWTKLTLLARPPTGRRRAAMAVTTAAVVGAELGADAVREVHRLARRPPVVLTVDPVDDEAVDVGVRLGDHPVVELAQRALGGGGLVAVDDVAAVLVLEGRGDELLEARRRAVAGGRRGGGGREGGGDGQGRPGDRGCGAREGSAHVVLLLVGPDRGWGRATPRDARSPPARGRQEGRQESVRVRSGFGQGSVRSRTADRSSSSTRTSMPPGEWRFSRFAPDIHSSSATAGSSASWPRAAR